jgi:WH2 motif-containing protein
VDARSGLLDQIRAGRQLKKASERKLAEKKADPSGGTSTALSYHAVSYLILTRTGGRSEVMLIQVLLTLPAPATRATSLSPSISATGPPPGRFDISAILANTIRSAVAGSDSDDSDSDSDGDWSDDDSGW